MIIIDQVADTKLAKTLETLEAQSATSRMIYFKLSQSTAISPELTKQVVAAARERILTADAQVYLCEDGDIFILAPAFPTKEAHQFMLSIGELLSRPVDDSWATLHDLPAATHALQAIVAKKLERARLAAEAEKQMQELVEKSRKREAILSVAVSNDNIVKQRADRLAPEFMIIEDDAFSRRLVENVLKKKYSLTGLGEATDALNTYARLAPNVLFLDINLPDVTGHELLEKIVALDPEAYVVMLSGNADKENITQAMRRGAKGFIAKPFTQEKLFQYIDRCPTIKHS